MMREKLNVEEDTYEPVSRLGYQSLIPSMGIYVFLWSFLLWHKLRVKDLEAPKTFLMLCYEIYDVPFIVQS